VYRTDAAAAFRVKYTQHMLVHAALLLL